MLGSVATPAGAVAAPVAPAPAGSTVQGEPEGLNVAQYVIAIGLGLAVGLPVACGARIAHERSIRRFRGQLHDADIVALCAPPIVAQQDRAGHQEPPVEPPGP